MYVVIWKSRISTTSSACNIRMANSYRDDTWKVKIQLLAIKYILIYFPYYPYTYIPFSIRLSKTSASIFIWMQVCNYFLTAGCIWIKAEETLIQYPSIARVLWLVANYEFCNLKSQIKFQKCRRHQFSTFSLFFLW